MPVSITGTRMGRPDYSVSAEKVAVSTYKADQEPYNKCYEFSLSPGWFGMVNLTVPSGKKLILRNVLASCASKTLITIEIYRDGSLVGAITDYQRCNWFSKEGLIFDEGETMQVRVYNQGDVTVEFTLNLNGLYENV